MNLIVFIKNVPSLKGLHFKMNDYITFIKKVLNVIDVKNKVKQFFTSGSVNDFVTIAV